MDFNACARFISTIKLEGTSLNAACAAEQQADCNLNYKYRSIDGTCNNLENPKLGSVMTAYTRLLFPEYMDGKNVSNFEGSLRWTHFYSSFFH